MIDAMNTETIVVSTAVALGIGLLIGTERERSKGSGPDREIAGVRTFALVSLLGVVAALLDNPLVIAAFALIVGAIAIAGYLQSRATDPGVTTEIALLVAFALGALSLPYPAYSAGAAVVVTLLLAARPWLHEVVKRRLTEKELRDVFLLAAAALIVLPLLPNHTIDPWDIFNPYRVWIVVVLVMVINALGYVGLRLWGPSKGLMVAGILGGLVSSAATHAAMGSRSKQQPAQALSAAAAATFSSVVTALFILSVIVTVDVSLTRFLVPACIAAALTSVLYGLGLLALSRKEEPHEEINLGQPINLRAALVFGATISAVLMTSLLLSRWFGPKAALTSTAVAGFADAHSSAISAAMLARNNVLTFHEAQLAVLCAFTANAVTKIIVSYLTGSARFAGWVTVGLFASTSALWIAWFAFS
jgi:uncharacterized membrane protein (DUF4010 family)